MKTVFTLCLLLVMLGLAPQGHAQAPAIAGLAPVIEWGIGNTYMQSTVPSQGKIAMPGVLISGSADINFRFGANVY